MHRFHFRPLILPSLLLTVFAGTSAHAYDYTAPVPLHTTAKFDPTTSTVPFPTDLLRQGSLDLSLNIPIATGTSAGQTAVYNALNSLDGFSTTAPWSTTFASALTAASVIGGKSVHLYEVKTDPKTGAVLGIIRELASPQEYVAALPANAATGATLALVPTRPLKQLTSYMAVLTNGITDAGGAPTRQSLIYGFAKRTSPLCQNGVSVFPALADAQACALEPLRQLTNLQEAAAKTAGVDPSTIVLSWTATTQATTVTMQSIAGLVDAAPDKNIAVVPIGKTLGDLIPGQPPIADIYVGTLTVPYYLSAPSKTNPVAPLTNYWTAPPCGQVASCKALGLDPTSTKVTVANPLPVATSQQTVPVLMSVPNANSGKAMPSAGWPVVIYEHGITSDRTSMLAAVGALSQAGFAVISIDLPLHGLAPTNPFYGNQLLAGTPAAALMTGERTFNLPQIDSVSGQPVAGSIASSGSYFINLSSLRTSRDNLRQGVSDLLALRSAIPYVKAMNGTPLFDASRVAFLGISLGSIEGTTFMALAATPNTAVQNAVLNVPGGGVTNLLIGSPTFGPTILAGLATNGILPGTSDFNTFVVATQSVIDSGDPINYAGDAGTGAVLAKKNLLAQVVVGGSAPLVGDTKNPKAYDANGKWLPDQVITNTVPNAPLSGGLPIVSLLGLAPIGATTQSPTGIHNSVLFVSGVHSSLLDPSASPQTTVEMQGEAASFFATNGAAVQVTNGAVVKH
ncbi:MAG: lipase [Proteobacteria bacterium]|nr:lipase [Pseudomonadota bacterium]